MSVPRLTPIGLPYKNADGAFCLKTEYAISVDGVQLDPVSDEYAAILKSYINSIVVNRQ
jgi:hypothetical protein